jgi:hypothetical protein
MSLTLRRPAALVSLLVTTLAATLLVVTSPAAPASAGTGVMRACRLADDDAGGRVYRRIQIKRKAFAITHAQRARVPRGANFTRSVTMTKQTVLEASMSGTVTASADAGAFFAKASVEASVTVAGRGEKTSSRSVTEEFNIPKTNRDRVFVFYSGVDTFAFRTHKRVCNRGTHDSYGRLSSFNPVVETGAVQCPSSRYRRGSIPWQVARGAGC